MTSKELLSYEEDQKKQLEDILSKMSGVGQVVVTIHFESGETQVPATNSSTQTSETQERIQMEVQGLQSKKQKVQL